MTLDDIALTLYKEINSTTAAHLISCFGSAEVVFAASPSEIVETAGLTPELAARVSRKERHAEAEKETRFLAKHGYKGIAATDDDYPADMLTCIDRPHVIYYEGNTDILHGEMLAMVGTRDISTYGQVICDKLVKEIAEHSPDTVIVSGLAFGIDVACQRAALKYGLKTISVLGTPLNKIYPSQHTDIAREIIAKGGGIISEAYSTKETQKHDFASRNRIIAGMSKGTVIVESPPKGGSLITADLAWGYDRPVMAVPGRASDWSSAGTNALIKSLKAQMVCTGRDILFELGWEESAPQPPTKQAPETYDLPPNQRKVMECFKTKDIVPEFELAEMTGLAPGDIAEAVFVLECNGFIKALAGGKYEKL